MYGLDFNPIYLMLVLLIPWLMKLIDCGQLIIKQRVTFNPILNSIYYIFGIFSLLTISTMFNERGLIYHRLMIVILFGITAFVFIPSVFVKPTINSLISTILGTILALTFGILAYFLTTRVSYKVITGFVVYLLIFFIMGAVFHNLLNHLNQKGKNELFYKQKLWELLTNRNLIVLLFSLFAIELVLQFYGLTILFFSPI